MSPTGAAPAAAYAPGGAPPHTHTGAEARMLEGMRDPAKRIADAEEAAFEALTADAEACELATLREGKAKQLRREVETLRGARAILKRVGAEAGVPPAAALRCAEAGLEQAAERFAPAA